jgi:hypothetical protein
MEALLEIVDGAEEVFLKANTLETLEMDLVAELVDRLQSVELADAVLKMDTVEKESVTGAAEQD